MRRNTRRRGRSNGGRANGGWANSPRGLTLVEILMSLLVTGIGVLSVMALLPLAFIRSVQATNLTNGTILRYNAESLLDNDPVDLVYTWPPWRPSVNYNMNDTVVAFVDPTGNNHYFKVTGFLPPAPPTGPWASQPTSKNPAWNVGAVPGSITNDNSIQWTDQGLHDHYVVDPMGALAIGNTLGNNTPAGLPAGWQPMPRFGGGANGATLLSTTAASLLAAQSDSWLEVARGPVTASTAFSATLSGVDLSGVAPTAPPGPPSLASPPAPPPAQQDIVLSRIVLFDLVNGSGKNSQTRIVTGIATPTVYWTANGLPAPGTTNDPLPPTFTPTQARVETQERRYTWMLTVRRDTTGQASVDATVFFRRALAVGSQDEQVYTATGTDGLQAPFVIDYTGPTKPFAKKGSFMFDISYGRWYRITDIVSDTGTQLSILVDRLRPQTDVLANPANTKFGVVFMRGVVDVFPLGNQ